MHNEVLFIGNKFGDTMAAITSLHYIQNEVDVKYYPRHI